MPADLLNVGENIPNGQTSDTWIRTWSLHSVSFATACLAICEYCACIQSCIRYLAYLPLSTVFRLIFQNTLAINFQEESSTVVVLVDGTIESWNCWSHKILSMLIINICICCTRSKYGICAPPKNVNSQLLKHTLTEGSQSVSQGENVVNHYDNSK